MEMPLAGGMWRSASPSAGGGCAAVGVASKGDASGPLTITPVPTKGATSGPLTLKCGFSGRQTWGVG